MKSMLRSKVFWSAFMVGYWTGTLICDFREELEVRRLMLVVHPVPLADEAGVWLMLVVHPVPLADEAGVWLQDQSQPNPGDGG